MEEAEWAITEFGSAMLGDARRTDRLIAMATVLGQRPGASIPAACDDLAMRKGTYRFLENGSIEPGAMLAAHVEATWERVGTVPVILAVQDTTDLDFSTHPATEGLGPLGRGAHGLSVHSTLAVTPEGLPVGLLAQDVWARPSDPPPKKRPLCARESHKWLTSLAQVAEKRSRAPQTHLVSVGDREADFYDLFVAPRPAGVDLLIRARFDRWVRVATDEHAYLHGLRDTLATAPVAGTREITVSRQAGQPARAACVTVRSLPVTLTPPRARLQELPSVPLWAVAVREEHPPAQGGDPLNWLLLTTMPVTTPEDALERVAWYVCRWVIEVWHKVLKSGCAIEQRQFASAATVQRGLALFSVIAWRVLYATLLARAAPDLPCTVLLETTEWQALYCAIHKTPQPPSTRPTLGHAVLWLARLGGYMARTSDGPPGPEVLWRGLHRLVDLTLMFEVFTPSPNHRKCG